MYIGSPDPVARSRPAVTRLDSTVPSAQCPVWQSHVHGSAIFRNNPKLQRLGVRHGDTAHLSSTKATPAPRLNGWTSNGSADCLSHEHVSSRCSLKHLPWYSNRLTRYRGVWLRRSALRPHRRPSVHTSIHKTRHFNAANPLSPARRQPCSFCWAAHVVVALGQRSCRAVSSRVRRSVAALVIRRPAKRGAATEAAGVHARAAHGERAVPRALAH